MVSSSAYPELALLIDGAWERGAGRESHPVLNPATGKTLGHVPLATAHDIDRAASAAHRAFGAWKSETALSRARILSRVSALLRRDAKFVARYLTLDQGKTLREAEGEVVSAADTFEWMAEEGKRAYGRVVPSRFPFTDQYVLHEPVGPVAAFSPWNYPLALASRKIATALAAGCTVVIKPAEETPGALVALGRLCMEAGLPSGVLNILFGVPAQVSGRLIRNDLIKKVSFTGSNQVGRGLSALAGAEMKKITLELGGHSPVIVMQDVNVEKVAELSVQAKFRNAGQICFSPTRYFVHRDVYPRFVECFAEGASTLEVGNGLDDAVQMGPLANERRVSAMRALVDDARRRGGRLSTGDDCGEQGDSGGFFWAPTIICDVPDDSLLMRQEAFGPLAAVVPFVELSEVVQRANAVEYGLGSYAFTNDARSARYIQKHIQAGSLSINTYALSPAEMPFRGIKESGTGVEMGTEGLAEHLNTKAVIWADLN